MRFEAEHHFRGSPGQVAAVLTDPDFYGRLVLPDVGVPRVVERAADGPRSTLGLRYEFTGTLDPTARRIIGPNRLAWVQEVEVDTVTGSGELTFHAQADPRRLHGSARFTLEPQDGGCVRRLTGDLVVAVPLIGSRAEGRIVPGILRRLDIEAEAVNQVLGR